MIKNAIYQTILNNYLRYGARPKNAPFRLFLVYIPRASKYSGSTALCGIHCYDSNKNPIIWVANVGDSRAVLCKKNGFILCDDVIINKKGYKTNYVSTDSKVVLAAASSASLAVP